MNKNRTVSDQSRHNIGRCCSLVICDTVGSPFKDVSDEEIQ